MQLMEIIGSPLVPKDSRIFTPVSENKFHRSFLHHSQWGSLSFLILGCLIGIKANLNLQLTMREELTTLEKRRKVIESRDNIRSFPE